MKDKTFLYLIQGIVLVLTGEKQIFLSYSPRGRSMPSSIWTWTMPSAAGLATTPALFGPYRRGLLQIHSAHTSSALPAWALPFTTRALWSQPPPPMAHPSGALMQRRGSTPHHSLNWEVLSRSLLLAMQWPNTITQAWALPRDSGKSKLVLRDLVWLTEESSP